MGKIAKPLTAIEVKRLNTPGQHPVGTVSGLRLFIKATGTKSWVLRVMVGHRRKDLGLGSYPTVTLAMAIEKAREARLKIDRGIDPVEEKRAQKEHIEWTFEKCAEEYIKSHQSSWKNAKHTQQWINTLNTYVYPKFKGKHVRDIDKSDVLRVIEPEWNTKNETMKRVRQRIEMVISWAMARGYRPEGLNPAEWRGRLDQVLAKPSRVNQRKNHASLPVEDMYDFMQKIKKIEGISARCLEFVILTASRSGEARGAKWSEIDLINKHWLIPAIRMKNGIEHKIPLSTKAIKLIEALPVFEDCEYLFPGRNIEKPISDMSMLQCVRRLNAPTVVYGFRATFGYWVSELTNYSRELREKALSHKEPNETVEAYVRGILFEKRIPLMEDWAKFIYSPSK